MFDFKLLFVLFSFIIIISQSKANEESSPNTETSQENNQLEQVQEHLITAFDSLKKKMEEFTSKINADEIVQGIQNLTSKLEIYAKKTAEQFAYTAAGNQNNEEKKDFI